MTRPAAPLVPLLLLLATSGFAAATDSPKQAGTDVPAPERTEFVKPVFPPEALARGEQALVVVELTIDEQGRVVDAKVLHGPDPFDKAALEAVKKWRYKVTKVEGRAVRVRHTISMSFAAKLPDMKRDTGVPELRQGVAPVVPAGTRGASGRAVARVEVDGEGRIAESTIKSGESPWSEALLQAIATWRFASPEGGARVSFDVRAEFKDGKVGLDLTGVRRVETGEEPAAVAAADVTTSVPDVVTPTAGPATSGVATDQPAIEVVSLATPRPTPAAPATAAPVVENGLSSVRDVTLDPGIPDLVRGRRPVAPPLARLGEIEGEVQVRFSIDSGGVTTVHGVEGRDELKAAAESLVRSWVFRRSAPHRLFALAQLKYGTAGVTARVTPTS
jgi:TonB family protein